MKQKLDLTNQRFGKLIVLYEEKKIKYERYWLCKCDCGNIKKIAQTHLRRGTIRSCGCYQKEFLTHCRTKHNKKHTKIYHIFAGIKRRCYNKNDLAYKNYGGRGIVICNEWMDKENGFLNFYEWAMSNGYKDGLTIDRIDVNGNYEANNCRWVSMEIQLKNKRNTKFLEYNNQKMTINEWCKKLNLTRSALTHRLVRGWSIEKALSTPLKTR